MEKNLIFVALIGTGIVSIIGLLIFLLFKKKGSNSSNETFNEEYVDEILKETEDSRKPKKNEIKVIGDKYKVLGNKNEYIISFKGDRINFLIKNNEIIGFIDKEKSNKIYYYEKIKGDEENV